MTDDVKLSPRAHLPDLDGVKTEIAEFCLTISKLRDPEGGCPWDLQQDHKSLRRYMIEEAYEAAAAMDGAAPGALCDELGDVLLQVVLNAQVALDTGTFSLVDVIRAINHKMRRRHPHVFAPDLTHRGYTSQHVRQAWEVIKGQELSHTNEPMTIFAEAIPMHPAAVQARKIGKIAAKIDFDWDSPNAVLAQVKSEIEELEAELIKGVKDQSKVAEELGDVYFSLAQLARHLDLDPEVVALDANKKFLRRFELLESIAKEQALDVRSVGRDQLELLWAAAKAKEKAGPQRS